MVAAAINRHLSIEKMIKGILGLLIVNVVISLLAGSCISLYERTSPTRRWFEYTSIVPTKTSFEKGEQPSFVSDIIKHRGLNVQQQDTLYCGRGNYLLKLATQYWPIHGTEYLEAGRKVVERTYDKPITADLRNCMMCGNTIGYTPEGHPKVWSYCTETFKVNQ